MEVKDLAKRMRDDTLARRPKASKRWSGYYMLNAGHWYIRQQLALYKRKVGVPEGLPLSDAQRLEFELLMLSEGVRRQIEKELEGAVKR